MKLKKILIIALVLIIGIVSVVAITHFGDKFITFEDKPNATQDNPTTEESTETLTEKPSESKPRTPLTASGQVLSESEIKDLLTVANDLYMGWITPAGALKVDWDDETEINGKIYIPAISGEFMTVDAINAELHNYFSAELYKERVNDLYLMHNDKLYMRGPYAEGGDIDWNKLKLDVKSSTPTECIFTVIMYFEENGEILEERENEYKLKVIDGKWKFADNFNWIVSLTINNTEIEWIK